MSEHVRILLVEDNPADVDLVREALPDAGAASFLVESAPRLSVALARLEAGGIDLVLLDLGLPDSLGLDTLRKTRDAAPNVPVIVLTGNDDQAVGLAAVSAGAQDYLVKGEVTGNSLARSLRHAIARRRAEEALQESEERLSLALEATRDGVYDVDFVAGRTYHSPGYAAMLGYRPTELVPVPTQEVWEGLLHPDDIEGALQTFHRCLKGEADDYDMEFRLRTKAGDWRWIRSRGRVIRRDPAGNPLRLVGTHIDITERRQAEDMLRREREILARTEGVAKIGSWEWDIATDTVTWSDELFRIFQREPREGAPSFAEHPTLYPSDDMARLRRAVEVAVTEGTPYELELRAIRRDGEMRLCVARGRAEMAQGGRAFRLFGSLQDITERKQAEEALSKSEAMFRSLFESMAEGAALHEMVYGADGKAVDYRIVDVNPGFEVQTGIAPEHARGRLATELYMIDAAPYLDIYERVARTGEPHSFETYFPPLDKSFSISVSSPKRDGFATLFADITERKRAEERIESQLDELERWRGVMLDREDRVQEVKREVNELLRRLGEPIRYPDQEDADAGRHEA